MTPSFLDLLTALQRQGIEFVAVGGVAAVLQGAPMTTLDLDIVYSTTDENLVQLADTLAELDAIYRDPAGRTIQPTVEHLRKHR